VQYRSARACLPLPIVCAVLSIGLIGCDTDTRMSYGELLQRQNELAAAAAQPVSVPAPRDLNLTDYRRYRIQNGDVLQLTMTGVAADRYTPTIIRARVDDKGEIVLPLAGAVKLAGLDYTQAENAILAAHKTLITEPFSVYVELVGPESTTVVVTGAATTPGLITLAENERSLLAALSRAGALGVTTTGRVQYKPIDPKRETMSFDLADINDIRRMLLLPPLSSGDTIVVEAPETNVVYLTGLLNGAGGAIVMPRDAPLTLMQALAAAGGTREFIDVKDATLVRRLADGSQLRAQLPIQDILDGKEPDLVLAAGDIVQMPHTLGTRVQDWVNNNVIRQMSIGLRYDPLQQYNTNRIIDQQNRLNGGGLRNSVLLNLSNLLLPTTPPPLNP
jgi:polysaccharide export outer membrane protein